MDATDGVKTPEKMDSEISNLQETPQTMPQPESSLQLLETQPAKESFRCTFASPIRDPMHVDGSDCLNLADDISLPPILLDKNNETQQPETVSLVPEANRPQVKKNDLQRNDDQTQEKEEIESKDLHTKHVQPDMDVQIVNDEQSVSSSANVNLKIAVEALISLASSPSTVQSQDSPTAQGDIQERIEQEKTEGEDSHTTVQPDQTVNVEKSDTNSVNGKIEMAVEALISLGSSPTTVQSQPAQLEPTSCNKQIQELEPASANKQGRSEQEETECEDFLTVNWSRDSVDLEIEKLINLSPMTKEEEAFYVMDMQPALDRQTVIEITDSGSNNNELIPLASSPSAVQPQLLPSIDDISTNTTGHPIMTYVGVAPKRRYTITELMEPSTASKKRCLHRPSQPREEHIKADRSFMKNLTILIRKRSLRRCTISSYKKLIPNIPKRVKARQSGTVAPRRSKRLIAIIQQEVEPPAEAARPPKRRRQNEVMRQDSPPTTSRNLRSSTTNTAEVPKKPDRPKKKTAEVPKKPGRPKKKPAQVPKKPERPKKNK